MIITTNLIDISKITLENYNIYNERIKYEVSKQRVIRNIKTKRKPKTLEERKEAQKIYQHNYYLEVTKPKRKLRSRLWGK